MKYLDENEYFSTKDMALATTISYFGYPIEDIDKDDPSRSSFIFKRNKKLDELVQGFWSNSLKVSPLAFFNSLRSIKTQLYQS